MVDLLCQGLSKDKKRAADSVNKSVRFNAPKKGDDKSAGGGAAQADEKLSAGASALDISQSAPESTLGKLVDKLAKNSPGVTLDEVHAITSCLSSPVMAISTQAEESADSVSMVEDFLSLAFVTALNSHQTFATSQNISECTGYTRLTSALLDTVKNLLDHVSSKIE